MDRDRIIILACGGLATLAMAATAIAQVNQALRPRPAETTLQPSRADAAALAQARQSPLAARLQTVLANDANYARILAQAQASSVPVLAPPDPTLLQTARYYPGDRQYTLVVRPAGQIVEILGSTLVFQAPEGAVVPSPARTPATGAPGATRAAAAPTVAGASRLTAAQAGATQRTIAPSVLAQRVRQSPLAASIAQAETLGLREIRTERTEYGVDVSFVRFGVVYNVTFVCENQTSLECSDAAAVQFASRLELIGGGH